MSDLKHTPGPWSCMSESAHEGVYLDDCVHSVSKAAGRADIICLSPSHEDYELSAAMWDANARLIAAAPELLAALRKAVEETGQMHFEAWMERVCPSGDVESVQRQWLASSDHSDFVDEWREQIDAIAKATGERA